VEKGGGKGVHLFMYILYPAHDPLALCSLPSTFLLLSVNTWRSLFPPSLVKMYSAFLLYLTFLRLLFHPVSALSHWLFPESKTVCFLS
jgi:hypothetical protein